MRVRELIELGQFLQKLIEGAKCRRILGGIGQRGRTGRAEFSMAPAAK
jgi:hypothetical protein